MHFPHLRSRSRSRCRQQSTSSSSGPQTATPRPSVESRDSSLSVSSVKSRRSEQDIPPVPPLPSFLQPAASTSVVSVVPQDRKQAALALLPFLANLPQYSALPDEDVDLWLAAVEAVTSHVGALPDAPVPLIPLLLRGNAFKRFVRIHHETRGRLTTWEDWKDHLRLEFRSANYEATRRDQLAHRLWQPTEDLVMYFDQRRTLQMVALPHATEEELVEDMLSGLPMSQRRLVTDSIPFTHRTNPSLSVIRRAMLESEVDQRGRSSLRADPGGDSDTTARARSHIPASRQSTSNQPQSPGAYRSPSSAPRKHLRKGSESSSGSSVMYTPPQSAHGDDHPPVPTITVSY